MRKTRKKGRNIGFIIFVVILVILSLILVIQTSYIFSELRDDQYEYSTDEDDYIRMVTYENYHQILHEAAYDSRLGKERTQTEEEIRALGYYYEAASLYKAYNTVGDSESADRQKARMDRYREEAGEYASETDNIDALLGIE